MQTSVIHQPPKPVDPKAESVVEIKDLYKSFGSNHVLRGFNLNLKKGENLVVLGKSGSGKSVLIKCMVGLLTPDKGIVEVFGKNIPIKGFQLKKYSRLLCKLLYKF